MQPHYTRISDSLVAQHPDPIGVIEFYGGEFFGTFPTSSYEYFLETLYQAGYTIIAVPFSLGLNHYGIAKKLLQERDAVRERLPELEGVPHFWVGHSVGCKYIALLEALTDADTKLFTIPGETPSLRGILNEPSLLMAPDIPSTADAIRAPILPAILDILGLGVRPSREETQKLIEEDDLFNLTGLISFDHDTVAGNESQPPEKSTVAWLIKTLSSRTPDRLLHSEIPGEHLTPVGVAIGSKLYRVSISRLIAVEPLPRKLEPLALKFLDELEQRRARAVGEKPRQQYTVKFAPPPEETTFDAPPPAPEPEPAPPPPPAPEPEPAPPPPPPPAPEPVAEPEPESPTPEPEPEPAPPPPAPEPEPEPEPEPPPPAPEPEPEPPAPEPEPEPEPAPPPPPPAPVPVAAEPVKAAKSDDLQKVEGIGPKIANVLIENGILDLEDLTDAPVERLREILRAAGSRYAMVDPGTWPEQALLGAMGEWDALKELQDKLDKGRYREGTADQATDWPDTNE